jgi:hypothetical protein
VLGEGVTPHQIAGAAIIATALAIIDGRLVERISHIRIR